MHIDQLSVDSMLLHIGTPIQVSMVLKLINSSSIVHCSAVRTLDNVTERNAIRPIAFTLVRNCDATDNAE